MRTVVVVLSMVLVLAGLAPLVEAQDTRTVTGTVTRVNRDNHTVHVRPDGGGAELTIVTRNFADTEKSIRAGDRVTATVRDDPAHKGEKWVVAQSISRAGSSSASSSSSSSNGWQQIHGVVREVQGSTLTLRADDGRRLTVDMSKVGTEIQQNLQRGDRVTVAAHEVSGNQVRAEFIQKNSSASGAPAASPSSKSVDEKDWQRIHGTVENVRGSRLTLKADDGRTLDVDMRDVSPEIRRALTQGEKVTVAGFYRGDDDRKVTARFIQQDSSKK
jgi:preprotein translocase subunit YajC